MMNRLNDPDPGRQKTVTNSDEQEIAVNHSDASEGGYDEPSNSTSVPTDTDSSKDHPVPEKKKKVEGGTSFQSPKG